MNISELSAMFDTLLNSYASRAAFGDATPIREVVLDEYEKSIFLTKAQEELVVSLYNGRNSSALSFEESEELRRYLSNLVETTEIEPIRTSNGLPLGVYADSKFFTLPEDLWFITYEAVKLDDNEEDCFKGKSMDVYPVRQDEYHKIKKNPFRGANDRRALRLDLGDDVVEIVCKHQVTSYCIRYIRKVRPIILESLPNGLTINGETGPSECELHSGLHHKLLEIAVQMALFSKGYSRQEQK